MHTHEPVPGAIAAHASARRRSSRLLCAAGTTLFAALGLVAFATGARGGDDEPTKGHSMDVPKVIESFSAAWPADRTDFRQSHDDSWKTYGTALRDLVASNDVVAVSKGLGDENQQVRALSARALGFLGDASAVPSLVKALEEDAWPTVRLLAADSLGMIRTDEALAALAAAAKTEKTGDVLLHVGIASRRESAPGDEPRKAVISLDPKSFDQAKVGEAAPAFDLRTPAGKRIALSDFKGKSGVVLLFLYGDG